MSSTHKAPAAACRRILIVTRNLPPLVGGMERLNWHIADELSRDACVRVVGPEGSAALRPDAVDIYEVAFRPLWRFVLASAWRVCAQAWLFKPDIIFAGSGLTAPAAFLASRFTGARSCVYLHGLDAAVKHSVYRAIWNPLIRSMDVVVVNSAATAELARRLGVANNKIRIVHPGVGLPLAAQAARNLRSFRARHGLDDAHILISVGRLTTRKGLREFVIETLPEVVRAVPNTLLVIVGEAPLNALHATAQSCESIQRAADAVGVGEHLRFLGVITDREELACAYECAAVHVFPVREIAGDPEGFGMVAVEAAAHGVPTAAFATGGVIDAVSPEQSGLLVASGDYAGLARAITRLIAEGPTVWAHSCQVFAMRFAWPEIGRQLSHVLEVEHQT
ncbi:GDP-mannose-dependent alpha-(1-6)-phosphatidylinositol monomannoside mannosyltransferase [Xylophilus ampelinus]|nr:GDP-mannose-dependent alpha-(1-6)-phosphatidylinositol monomannoside mannosyltransferase [Xylophilus ampelinus]